MVKTHRVMQQWEHWLTSNQLGNHLLECERQHLLPLLAECFGKHALLIGTPKQYSLMKFSAIPQQVLLSPLMNKKHSMPYVETELYELPISSGAIDLVIVPHTLEQVDNPQRLLGEACRIVRPGGYIIIFGFNPYSLWGLKKYMTKEKTIPWSNHFLTAGIVKKWLSLVDFKLIKQNTFLFRPPLQHHESVYHYLKMMEWLGNKCWTPLGGVYMLMAKAQSKPLTPIKLHWKQRLSGVQVSVSGPSMRNLK